jgi:hypothetical protein
MQEPWRSVSACVYWQAALVTQQMGWNGIYIKLCLDSGLFIIYKQ